MSQQQHFAEALLDPGLPCPPGLRTWNGSDPARRFAVYRNNVIVSLVDALADTFPVTQELVGEAFFRAMARLFVYAHPPTSPCLAFYGETFPDFIGRFPPAAGVPYLADMARLEFLRLRAYHAADVAPIATDELAGALAEEGALPELKLAIHPSLGVVNSKAALVSLWAAHQGVGSLSDVVPDVPQSALILRESLEVEVIEVPRAAGFFIGALVRGEALGRALESAQGIDTAFEPAMPLGLLIQKGVITALYLPRSTL